MKDVPSKRRQAPPTLRDSKTKMQVPSRRTQCWPAAEDTPEGDTRVPRGPVWRGTRARSEHRLRGPRDPGEVGARAPRPSGTRARSERGLRGPRGRCSFTSCLRERETTTYEMTSQHALSVAEAGREFLHVQEFSLYLMPNVFGLTRPSFKLAEAYFIRCGS